MNLDGAILLWIQEWIRSDLMNPIMIKITHLGDAGLVWIALSLFLLFPKSTRKYAMMAIVALLLSLLINNMLLKNIIARTRPYEVVEGLNRLIGAQHDFSFPSGHTASSFATAVVLFCNLKKRYGIPLLILAVLISLSRLYVGVHYPTDVLFGAISGTLLAVLAQWLVNGILERRRKGGQDEDR